MVNSVDYVDYPTVAAHPVYPPQTQTLMLFAL